MKIDYKTAGKWKAEYNKDPEKKVPLKKANRTSNRAVSKLNEKHKAHLIDFFDENCSTVIQDAVENLIRSFEFMKGDCNLGIKVVICHPKVKNNQKILEPMQNKAGFDTNMRRTRGWPKRGTPVTIESPSAKGVFYTVIGANSAFDVVNMSMREPDAAAIPKGTTVGHYVEFISDTLGIKNEFLT
ncbi:uncharacterized protein RHIMIDRAFT_292898 [Rhizopus microsporus ATCC 52813]|uniref:Uncharacterized protein n=1 Tax=Rhizopus microsporus ATCC 52813 TaxID=1340429 RepID=A0A2G4SRE4_RHIZD|nr:uncharacterized protein RHIMIDRAFT_292898 [Rhizopus microsporus ATCC 52813]PHZ11330.1 hypothetical protein RHIMIDRAFT_292898 [Rhizopus microsporus ATCC 52813]